MIERSAISFFLDPMKIQRRLFLLASNGSRQHTRSRLINTHPTLAWDSLLEQAHEHYSERLLFVGLRLTCDLSGASAHQQVYGRLSSGTRGRQCHRRFSTGFWRALRDQSEALSGLSSISEPGSA